MKKRIYIDMDDTLCDFTGEFIKNKDVVKYPQSKYGFFLRLEPLPGAIDGLFHLAKNFDIWILTRPSIMNPLSYTEKRVWVENHLGMEMVNKLILSPDKSLFKGDYLIDDHEHPGFEGNWLHFGSRDFPDWKSILEYFKDKTDV